jgi:hypothetical protein
MHGPINIKERKRITIKIYIGIGGRIHKNKQSFYKINMHWEDTKKYYELRMDVT